MHITVFDPPMWSILQVLQMEINLVKQKNTCPQPTCFIEMGWLFFSITRRCDNILGVSKNNGIPKSSILIGVFHYKPSILGYPYFWKHPFGLENPHLFHGGPPWTLSTCNACFQPLGRRPRRCPDGAKASRSRGFTVYIYDIYEPS